MRKSILVTGATSDIGVSIVRRLLREEHHLVVLAREVQSLHKIFSDVSESQILFIEADFEDSAVAVANTLEATKNFSISGVVHCAGAHELKMFALSTERDLQGILDVNLLVPLAITRALLTSGRISTSGASIVWISSNSILRVEKGLSAYALAKSGQISMTRSLAKELGRKGIRVNAILAGWVDTQSARQIHRDYEKKFANYVEQTPLGSGQPEDISSAVSFLMGNDSRWVTGSILTVDGGASL